MSTLLGHTKNMSISLFYNKINEPSLQRVNVFQRSRKGQKAWFCHLGGVSKHQEKTLFWWFSGLDTLRNKKCRTFDEFFSYFVHPHLTKMTFQMILRRGLSEEVWIAVGRGLWGLQQPSSSVYAEERGFSQLSWRLQLGRSSQGVGLRQVRLEVWKVSWKVHSSITTNIF